MSCRAFISYQHSFAARKNFALRRWRFAKSLHAAKEC
jgi:hypothetical protein